MSTMDIIPPPVDFSKDAFPEVFAKPPKNLTFGKPGQLTREQVEKYFEDVSSKCIIRLTTINMICCCV